MIFVQYEGRLGNNLFQWGFARILSKLSGTPMSADSLPLFPATHLPVSPRPDKIEFTLPRNYALVSVEDWVEKSRKGHVLVKFHPQRSSFFKPHEAWLRRELVPQEGEYTRGGPSDIVLHLRWGDFFGHRMKDKFSYAPEAIFQLLMQLSYDRCLIVTDSPRALAVESLIRHYRGVLVSRNIEHDYRTLYYASRLIMTPSTFSWWAAWSGHAKEIYQPHEMGYWKQEHGYALELREARVRKFNAEGKLL